jgi:xanthine dehydrogenase iron-sulfur cluster and FAD-binding subunit A
MSDAMIQRLSELLDRDEPVLLGAEERSLVRAALVGLAAAERRAAHLERLLEAHGASLDAADGAARGALEQLADAPDAPTYDFRAAEATRQALLDRIESARSAREIVSAALAFARDVAVLAG